MWATIEDHDELADYFRGVVRRERLASTYLFVGPAGIGKRAFARQLARALLCQSPTGDPLQACGGCQSCRLADSSSHPDLLEVCRPKDKNTLPIELFIGDRAHRGQEGLCHHLWLKPFLGGKRVAIIDDADYLSQESANCLLKTLEEPPPRSLLILIGTSPSRQLPTIRSRAQLVRFQPLPPDTVQRLLVSTGLITDASEAVRLAKVSQGSLQRAMELADPKLGPFRDELQGRLEDSPLNAPQLAQAVLTFVEAAGKEAAARRGRLRVVLGFAAEHYREQMRRHGTIRPVDQLDRCLAAAEKLDRYANQASLVHWWASGLDIPAARS